MREQKRLQKGSITVFLCLLFLIFLTVLSVSLQTVRVSAARVTLASAAEQSLFSVFGSYDKDLFDRYGLMFINAESGEGSLDMGGILTQAEDYASYIINPKKESILPFYHDILKMDQEHGEITAYMLATDAEMSPFEQQIEKALGTQLASDGVEKIYEKVNSAKETSESQEQENTSEPYTKEEQENAPVIENPPNPIDIMNGIKNGGLLYFVVPKGKIVSGKKVNSDALLPARQLNQGMGTVGEYGHGILDNAVLAEYAMRMLPNFTNPMEEEALQYQVEYLIGGKDTDAGNLKMVVLGLLAIREVANVAFLAKDETKRAEVLSMATAISTALMVPHLVTGFSWAVRAAWAYVESMMDVRKLLSGGKVPMVKTNQTWQVSMTQLKELNTYTGMNANETSTDEKDSGLDYQTYLRMLLVVQKTDTLKKRIAAMIEHTMQTAFQKETFHLDNCLAAVGIRFQASVGNRELICDRNYAYGQG